MEFVATIKKPWVKYSLIAIVGLFLVYVIYKALSGGGSTTVVTSNQADPGQLALAQQQNAISAQQQSQQAQLAGQANTIQGQLDLARINADATTTQQNSALATQYSIAQLTTAAQTHQNDVNVAGQLQLAGINSQNIQAQLSQQTQIGAMETAANIKSAQIQSDTLLGVSTLSANVQNHLSDNALQGQISNNNVQVVGINANQNIEIARINAASQSSSDSMWGSVAMGAMMMMA